MATKRRKAASPPKKKRTGPPKKPKMLKKPKATASVAVQKRWLENTAAREKKYLQAVKEYEERGRLAEKVRNYRSKI